MAGYSSGPARSHLGDRGGLRCDRVSRRLGDVAWSLRCNPIFSAPSANIASFVARSRTWIHRQERLDALVVRDELAVGERPLRVDVRHERARRDPVVVERRPADPGDLRAPGPHRRGPATTAGGTGRPAPNATGPPSSPACRVRAARSRGRVEPRARLEHQNLHPALGELLGHDRAAPAGADDDDVRVARHTPSFRYDG